MGEMCGAVCPGSCRVCERTDDHDEHRSILSLNSYVFWTDGYPVGNRPLPRHTDTCAWTIDGDRCTCARLQRAIEPAGTATTETQEAQG